MATATPARTVPDANRVHVLVTGAASVATAVLVLTAHSSWTAATARPAAFGAFLLLSCGLMLAAVPVYGREGSISVAGIGLLLFGFIFGIGPALCAGVVVAAMQAVRRRSPIHRAVFNAANLGVAAAVGTAGYEVVSRVDGLPSIIPAFAGGFFFWLVNTSLITLAMSLSEGARFLAVWRERFRWLTPHYLAFGPLALASKLAYESVGITGLVAFILPPALLMLSVQQYVAKTRDSVENLQRANGELAQRNSDLHDLFEFAAGLASLTHDRHELAAGVQSALERLTGSRAKLTLGVLERDALPLASGGRIVGGLTVDGGDEERWERLRDAILPQLATALESTLLVDQVRKTHLETIAALSRSMEAKDLYTGGHTERVSAVAVALAERLGYRGADLDAIEIGALLHDIGKIGIPERILHKAGPLDEEEWVVMRNHPVISEYILSEVALSPIVLQIARSSHERFDGDGYPDGLAGEEIPLPARIVLVADAFDALTSTRPYRGSRPPAAAMDELRAHAGTQFCPSVIEAVEQLWREETMLLIGEPALYGVA
jgi:putative nucleotidyltransferase with HDIG domain